MKDLVFTLKCRVPNELGLASVERILADIDVLLSNELEAEEIENKIDFMPAG